MLKVAIYHPNLHLQGGGEVVALTIAAALQGKYDVTILTAHPVNLDGLSKFFGLGLAKTKIKRVGDLITYLPNFSSFKPSLYIKCAIRHFRHYDLIIDTCSNGLLHRKIPQKTICYVHFPNYTKPKKGLKSLLNFLLIKEKEMLNYDMIICNSRFTQADVASRFRKNTCVVYPPVQVSAIRPARKKNIIATVGRISPEKKHEVMIEAFIRLENKLPDFSLHIIGTYNRSNKDYLKMLRTMADGHRIMIHLNLPHEKVMRFLEKSMIYWHARGYGESDPVEYENFGITTVEAMAAGCIPIVIDLGAQPEIVAHGKNGYLWGNIDQLIKYTLKSISPGANKIMLNRNYRECKKYSDSQFSTSISHMVEGLCSKRR